MTFKETLDNLISIEELIQIVKDHLTDSIPNLYTALEIKLDEEEQILINANEIIDIASYIIDLKIKELSTNVPISSGTGTKSDPYLMCTLNEWLWQAYRFEINRLESTYFRIGGQLVEVEPNERYVSAVAEAHSTDVKECYFEDTSGMLVQSFQNILSPTGIPQLQNQINEISLSPNQTIESMIHTGISMMPLMMHFAQGTEKKFNVEGREWLKTPYSKLATEHKETEQRFEEKFKAIEPEVVKQNLLAGLSQPFDIDQLNPSRIDEMDNLFNMFNISLENSNLSEEEKEQIKKVMSSLDSFKSLITKLLPVLLPVDKGNMTLGEVFSHLISHVSNLTGMMQNLNMQQFNSESCSTSSISSNSSNPVEHGKVESVTQNEDEAVSSLQSATTFSINNTLVEKVAENINNPATLKQIQALNHLANVNEIRSILANKVTIADRYLPETIAAMFFAETSRYPVCILASLAILDLIEANQSCPDVNENYNFNNLLRNSDKRELFFDAYGRIYIQDQAEIKDLVKDKIYQKLSSIYTSEQIEKIKKADVDKKKAEADRKQADGDKKKAETVRKQSKVGKRKPDVNEKKADAINAKVNEVISGKIYQQVAGYHPMVQGDSYKEIKNIQHDSSNMLKLVQQKIASILIQWISLKLQGNTNIVEVNPVRTFLNEIPTDQLEKNPNKQKILNLFIAPFLKERLASFNLMLLPINNNLNRTTPVQNNIDIISKFLQTISPAILQQGFNKVLDLAQKPKEINSPSSSAIFSPEEDERLNKILEETLNEMQFTFRAEAKNSAVQFSSNTIQPDVEQEQNLRYLTTTVASRTGSPLHSPKINKDINAVSLTHAILFFNQAKKIELVSTEAGKYLVAVRFETKSLAEQFRNQILALKILNPDETEIEIDDNEIILSTVYIESHTYNILKNDENAYNNLVRHNDSKKFIKP